MSARGATKEMQDARLGYEFFVSIVNQQNEGKGLLVNGTDGGIYFKFDFAWRDDEGDPKVHGDRMDELFDVQRVHFMFGSHDKFARDDSRRADARSKILYHCCVGLDEIYDEGFKNVFGVAVSYRRYTELAITSMNLNGIRTAAVLVRMNDTFTTTVCDAATRTMKRFQERVKEDAMDVTVIETFGSETGSARDKVENFVDKAAAKGVDAVVACVLEEEGKELVRALHRRK